ncbi:MAG: hypothetical protein WD749_01480 [Phycisphaerales bacterium]
MITVTLPESLDAKLRTLARPFETREALIDRIADAELARARGSAAASHAEPSPTRVLDAESPPSLTHAKLLSAMVGGHAVQRPDWNRVLYHLHVVARKRLGSLAAVKRASSANLRDGKHSTDGYHYLPEGGFSVQGVDANKAWAHALRLAQALGLSLEATFRWREVEGAAHPGQKGTLRWAPSAPAQATDVFAEMAGATVHQSAVRDSREAIYGRAEGE